MRKIHKYLLTADKTTHVTLTEDARVLMIDTQHGVPQVWVEFDESKEHKVYTFELMMTGINYPDAGPSFDYVGSFQIPEASFVGHMYSNMPKA